MSNIRVIEDVGRRPMGVGTLLKGKLSDAEYVITEVLGASVRVQHMGLTYLYYWVPTAAIRIHYELL